MSTVHYLAWAIPALGFFGTVRGLAMSLTMAGTDKANLPIDAFLSQATRHLNVAFDCTLVALALSLPIMFWLHSVQRDEEALVIDCQQYCLEHLINRIYEPEPLPEEVAVPRPARGRRGEERAMTLVGLDLNASRARAVVGSAGALPHVLMLDGAERDVPVQISLQGRHPEVGRAAAPLTRQLPHLVCNNFLAHLGSPKTWTAGRHSLDSSRAVTLVFERLRQACSSAKGVFLAVPAYLTREQGEALAPLAAKARLPLLGSIAGRWPRRCRPMPPGPGRGWHWRSMRTTMR